jgi:hypothetical protein
MSWLKVRSVLSSGAVLTHFLVFALNQLSPCAFVSPDLVDLKNLTHPETAHHLVLVNTELLVVTSGELANGEGPAMETRTEGNGTLVWVNLDITKSLVEVCGDNDVDRLNDTGEVLEQVFLGKLQFEQGTVDLVDNDDGLDTLTKSLSEDSLGLHTHTFNGVDDNESTIGDTERSSDFRGEINVTGRIDQVDQEVVLLGLLWDILQVLLVLELSVQGDGSRLDGDTTLLLIGTSIRKSSLASLCRRNNTGTLDEGVGEGRFAVIDYKMLSDFVILHAEDG